jgi:hypothetical protein
MRRRKSAGREITKSEFHGNISQLMLLMKILEDIDDKTKSNECIPFALSCGAANPFLYRVPICGQLNNQLSCGDGRGTF